MAGRTLIVGLGNPILGDDGVGWHVAEEVRRQLGFSPVADSGPLEIDCVALGGLSLMERLIGYDRAIVIDAMVSGTRPIGSVARLALEDVPDQSAGHMTAAHDTSLQNALKMGRAMGARLPGEVTVVAVEAQATFEFSEELSPPVAAAVPSAARAVMDLLRVSRSEE